MQQSEPESDYFTRIGKERRIAACAQPPVPNLKRKALMRSPVSLINFSVREPLRSLPLRSNSIPEDICRMARRDVSP